ncbi:IS481 family transposase [Chromatium okenii]|uniref:IS481 family transposase n=1 Tax=Chromatium okenii TaxID=61644 RepID=A0A2S7XNN1_9GAMM|nr:IS481 family transposase [Chromatium okenii]PQJ95340.1 IS481 family transposase [Chromatium okenii]
MNLNLHKNARTTPAIRRELQHSTKSERELAREYHLNRATVRKWRHRQTTDDASHCPHHLHTTLKPLEELIAVELRTTLLLPIDDLLVVLRTCFNPKVSRSGLQRCLRRHHVSNLKDLIPKEEGAKKPPKQFKDYAPGFIHIDIKYLPKMPDEQAHRYLFVAIDRATRWVYAKVFVQKTAANASAFLQQVIAAAAFKIEKVLTDNGKEFTDRFCATGEREPTGRHRFDLVCKEHQIEHRLIPPSHPQTNGMVERFNGRIAEVVATTRFDSAQNLEKTLHHYVQMYNHQIPQKALGHVSPVQALKNWQQKEPERFKKQVYNLSGLDR